MGLERPQARKCADEGQTVAPLLQVPFNSLPIFSTFSKISKYLTLVFE